ncbi:MAG: HNH endonuclease [Desulfobaccales bacterium]
MEHYLTAVLPFGGQHQDAITNFENLAPRLQKNRKLFGQLAQKQENVWINENGFTRLSLTVPFDASKLGKLFCFIVKGLMWHHWNVLLDSKHKVRAGCLVNIGEQLFQSFFNFNANQRVNADLGDGTFQYEGVQDIGSPQFSLWKFLVYGGLKLAGVPNMPSETPSFIWGITGRNEIISDLWDAR